MPASDHSAVIRVRGLVTRFGAQTIHDGLDLDVRRGEVLTAEHALVPPEIGGLGIAAKLVEVLVADARAQGWKIVPECSYVAAAFRRHPEWTELLA